jgi:hypothetical protein
VNVGPQLEGMLRTPGGGHEPPYKILGNPWKNGKAAISQLLETTSKLQNCQGFCLIFGRKFSKFFWFTHKLDIVP